MLRPENVLQKTKIGPVCWYVIAATGAWVAFESGVLDSDGYEGVSSCTDSEVVDEAGEM